MLSLTLTPFAKGTLSSIALLFAKGVVVFIFESVDKEEFASIVTPFSEGVLVSIEESLKEGSTELSVVSGIVGVKIEDISVD